MQQRVNDPPILLFSSLENNQNTDEFLEECVEMNGQKCLENQSERRKVEKKNYQIDEKETQNENIDENQQQFAGDKDVFEKQSQNDDFGKEKLEQINKNQISNENQDVQIDDNVQKQWSLFEEGFELPPNLHLLTFAEWGKNQLIIRIAHLFEVNDHQKFSKSVEFSLNKLLNKYFTVKKIKQVSLTANQSVQDLEKKRLKWRSQEKPFFNAYNETLFVDNYNSDLKKQDSQIFKEKNQETKQIKETDFIDVIYPMEIKTYIVDVDRKTTTDNIKIY
eukprot:TRINITY_DN12179_c0_g1_i3.p1 TRINITY_DN12179_c0_g1~~TRINITY_DN12179_c0_g1_i3.p1  ORF type:complete len:277 (-),score=46.42 TRINITY_DN12179_c0_g1_i3:996-1826(-)